jgi:predicted metal-dependent enzyme (double-stranded beta helix superfamily)
MTTIASWISSRVAAESRLTRAELGELVAELAGEPRFWAEYVRHDADTRYFHQLYRDPNLDVWLICWLNAQDTGYHDHDVSSGAVTVVGGELAEDYLYVDDSGWIGERTRIRAAGTVWDFDPASIHGLRHAGGPPATSLHVYSPALWRMGHYEPGPLGLLRHSITYADEQAGNLVGGVATAPPTGASPQEPRATPR